MLKQLDGLYKMILEKEISAFEDIDVSVDTLVVKIGSEFFGYFSKELHHKFLKKELDSERHAEIQSKFSCMATRLQFNGIDPMFCVLALHEGGGIVIATKQSLQYKKEILDILEDMEHSTIN